ncbi:MAG: hypothetical protein WDZ46_02340 [Solirubrobacterales bacterium]
MAAAFIVTALALWLSASQSTRAATAEQTQGVSATVASTISWGSAGECTQDMSAFDFGTLSAGGSSESTTFTGCVTSNAAWNVASSMTTAPNNSAEEVDLAASNFAATVTESPAGSTTSCGAEAEPVCSLDQSRSLVSAAPAETNSFSYRYTLDVPSSARGGTYDGGVVTFVASNAD